MPALQAPPALGAVPSIDPTPGPNDITNFEQARAASPAPEPASPAAPAPGAPAAAPRREVALSAPADSNKVNDFPEAIWEDLEARATDENGQKPAAKTATQAAPEESAAEAPATPPAADDPALEAEFEKQAAAHTTLKTVRTAYKEGLKREHKLKQEIETERKRLSELEGKLKTGDVEQLKAMTAELEAAKKATADYEAKIKALDYTQSQEFHERHRAPVAKALQAAYADLQEMLVTDERTGEQRPATEADFKALLAVPLHEATTKAKALFGDLASEVLGHRRGIVQLKRAEQEALANAGKLAEESLQRRTAEATQRQQKLVQVYQGRRAELEQKHGDLFKAPEGDAEASKVLAAGKQLAELLEDSSLSEEQRVALGTDIRVRAEAFGYMKLRGDRALKKVAELEAKLKAFEGSQPRDGQSAPNGTPPPPSDPMDRAMKGLEKLGRPL
jgi:hypothetical protein